MLVVESLSCVSDGQGGWMSVPHGGIPVFDDGDGLDPYLHPGYQFLGDTIGFGPGTIVPSSRLMPAQTMFHYARHARPGDRGPGPNDAFRWRGPAFLSTRGRTNIGFVDGHVRSFTPDELADRRIGISRFVALWTVMDPFVERKTYVGHDPAVTAQGKRG